VDDEAGDGGEAEEGEDGGGDVGGGGRRTSLSASPRVQCSSAL